jgi:hypothetical protein
MIKLPKSESKEESWYKNDILTFIVSSINNRAWFILYKVNKDSIEKIAKSKSPLDFRKYWKGGK